MFNWLRKAWGATKRVLGKVKSGVEGGVRLFNKGKEVYGTAKNFVSNLPVVGSVAKELIGKGEEGLNKYAKEKAGISFEDVNKGVGMADRVSKYLPSG
jgi:hypothetical protein